MTAIESESRKKPACAEKYAPVPECVVCPGCGEDVEVWSDEENTVCHLCGREIKK